MRPFVYTSFGYLVMAASCLPVLFHNDTGWLLFWMVTLVYISLLILGAIYIRWDFYVKSWHNGTRRDWVTLTFDDGPAAETAAILDTLKEQDVKATFFSIGKNAARHPELVRRWHSEGHLIGNHSYDHGFHFDWQRAEVMLAEMEKTNQTVEEIIGKKMKLFRPPYGVTNPNLAKAIRKSRMHSIGWNVRSFDTTAKEPERLLAHILNKVKGGDIILLHDSMPITRQILTELIITLRSKGYSFVRLDKLLDIPPYE
ncbi:MAG TPA: polysaccharide deacetylase family protein [Flavipsychrobacter sp.]|nr:polysaccharide deacetylase family protein [Flavipsychrobacter sp.]